MRKTQLPAGLPLALLLTFGALTTSSCTSAMDHRSAVGMAPADQFTLGAVQREIRPGMSQTEVAESLGSPNMVTRDNDGNETWVYDKIASEASYSESGSYGTILILGGSRSAGASSTSQRTLTVVIRFDDQSKVSSFTYHSSKF
jgi:outer membrane protein assembly factor BamE (lipoprotein component of BamABCDE complex)